jgi:hypothetical protein
MNDEELVIFEDGTQITMTLLETGIRVSTSQRRRPFLETLTTD